MKLIIHGKATVKVLKDIRIIDDDIHAPDDHIMPFACTAFDTRTSSGARDIVKILGFDEENLDSYTITHEELTMEKLFEIHKVLEICGEPEDAEDIMALKSNNAEFTAFVAPYE